MTTWQKIRLFFAPLRSNPRGVFFLLIYVGFFVFFNTYIVVIIQKITEAIESQDSHFFFVQSILLLVLFVVNYLTKVFYKPRNFWLIRDFTQYLDALYLEKFLQSDNNETEKIGTWRMISIMQQGIYTWVDILLNIFWANGWMILTVFISFYLVAKQSSFFFSVSVLAIFISIPWVSYFTKKSYVRRKICKDILVEKTRTTVRWIMSKFEIQQQDRYAYEIAQRQNVSDSWYVAKLKEKVIQAVWYDTVLLLFDIIFFGIVLYVWWWVLQWTSLFSDFVLLTWLAFVIQRNIWSLQIEIRKAIDSLVHVEKLMDVFHALKPKNNYHKGKSFAYKKGDISIENITYNYGGWDDVFDAFSVSIAWWKKTALVGSSGGGKSTLIKLISAYLTPDAGAIKVDGQDLSKTKLKTYYKHIGYLTQEPSVFDGTIYENLVYALDYSPNEEQLYEVIINAWCEFIYDLRNWLETEIWEKWVRLSGWQKQRLAIAKIFLKNPEIILLDEPTSALDSVSEEKISLALHKLFVWRTVIVVAHRLQTVKEADDIVVIEKGIVVERWTHTELRKKKWVYAKMLDLQTTF